MEEAMEPKCTELVCKHGKMRRRCAICKNCGHGKVKDCCRICSDCGHGKLRRDCILCVGCEHGKNKYHCKVCKEKRQYPWNKSNRWTAAMHAPFSARAYPCHAERES
jgi:hypothetical protein